jgi:AcrR family transcriptional regulator
MRPAEATVKSPRRYDASARRERALARRTAALDAAQRLFLTTGYLTTTVEAIAGAAGVSAATVYKSYGGKPGLLRDLCERALGGEGPVPAERRSDALRVDSTARELIEGWGRLLVEVSPRVSPLLVALAEAAYSDADAARLRDEVEGRRLARMADNAAALMRTGGVRPDVTADEARDVLWLSSAPELYDLLVTRRGWSVDRYGGHVTRMLLAALVEP